MARFQRVSAEHEIAANLLELCYSFDVSDVLSEIKTPTLILHREDDKTIPIQHGRQLASDIPGALFKVLKGQAHPPRNGDRRLLQHLVVSKGYIQPSVLRVCASQ